MPSLQHKRGTRGSLNALAGNGALAVGQIYLITDENRLAIATSSGTYQTFLKTEELPIIQQVTLNLPRQVQSHEQVVAQFGILPTNSVKAWLAPTVDTDNNDLWQLENVNIDAQCNVNQITFFFSSLYFESDDIKVNYEVR
jgi:hypothetical protein